MRITWVTRSFLDYRLPIYEEINRLCDNNLTLIYNAEVVPERCKLKIDTILGPNAIGLEGEFRLSGKKVQPLSNVKKNGIRIPIQPKLIKTIKNSRPDIIISDGFFQWTYAALWLRMFKKIPHIMCYEGTEHTERHAGFLRLTYRKVASRLIDVIQVNGSLSKAFVTNVLGVSDRKIGIGNMTAETELLKKTCAQLSIEDKRQLKEQLNLDAKVFLFIGRLVPLKGISHLLKVWNKLNTQDASLLIIGDGSEREQLEDFVSKNNIENVNLLGAIDYDEIYKFFGVSDCFIIPTLQDNWSLVVPEAMSCRLPIVCSKYNGCWPELVRKENGWVFDPLDEADFLKTFETVFAEEAHWEQMGKTSAKIVEEFSPKKIANNIFASVESVIARAKERYEKN